MPFCENCDRHMTKRTTTNKIVFTCAKCYTRTDGTDEDTLMSSRINFVDDASNGMYQTFKKQAAVDPTNAKELIPCPKCKMPYTTLIRLGAQDRGFLICSCGYEKLY